MSNQVNQITFYGYKQCGSCVKAVKFLEQNGVDYQFIPVRETPPKVNDLKQVHQFLLENKNLDDLRALKKLFNISGKDYREGDWKNKVTQLSRAELYKALASNGNLIKRPLVWYKDGDRGGVLSLVLVGFKEEEWVQAFKDFKNR